MVRPRYITPGDKRPAMLRLLTDCFDAAGFLNLQYDRQHRTMWRAQELGYIDANYRLTDKGREWLEKQASP